LRYARQCKVLGNAAEAKLHKASVAVVGLGGTGSFESLLLAQLGVRKLVLIDRDNVSVTNLNRQALYTAKQVGVPKALAARAALAAINPQVALDAKVEQFSRQNASRLLKGVDFVLDGTDNYQTRVAIDEACAKLKIPWVHAAALGARWQVSSFLPGRKPRFKTVFPKPYREVSCEDAGILNVAASIVAGVAVGEFVNWACYGKMLAAGRLVYRDVLTGEQGAVLL
jgi:adenylyltransferase/sulfurtransferase